MDPFNVFARRQASDAEQRKQQIALVANPRLQKMVQFVNQPEPNVVLGDSRSVALKSELFANGGAGRFFNFAFGGASLAETIDAFWFADRRETLRTVVFGVPFNLFNDRNRLDIFLEAQALAENRILHFLNISVTKVSAAVVRDRLAGGGRISEAPQMSKDEFWRYQLGPDVTGKFYGNFSYPRRYLVQLREVVEHCRRKGIRLLFLIPPAHLDLQVKVDEYGLQDHYLRYKADLAVLGDVLDYDFPSHLTRERELFSDPYHFNERVARDIARDILRGSGGGGRWSYVRE